MSLNALGVGLVLSAKDLASGIISKVDKGFRGLHESGSLAGKAMDKSFSAFKMGIAIMGAGLGILGGAHALATAYGEMDDALDAVAASTLATSDELDQLEEAAHRAALSTQFKAPQAVAALEVLRKSFGDTKTAVAELPAVLNYAGVSSLSTAAAARVITTTLKLYNLEAKEATRVSDTLARAQQITGLKGADMEKAFKKASSTTSQYGQSFEETLLGLALFKGRGLEAGKAAVLYGQTVANLATNTKQQAALASKNIPVMDKTTGKMRDASVIIADVVEATKTMTEKDRRAFVVRALGAKGMTAYDAVAKATFKTMKDGVPVTYKGTAAVAAMGEALGDAKGAASELNEALLDDFGGQQQLIESATNSIKLQVGKEMATALAPAAKIVVQGLRAIGLALLDIPAPIKAILAKGVLLTGVILTVAGGAIAAVAGIAILVLAIKAIGATALAVVAVLAPFIAIVGVMAAVLAGFGYAVKHDIGGVGEFVRAAVAKVRLAYEALVQLFQQGGFTGAVRKAMGEEANRPVREFAITVFMWVGRIKTFVRSLGAAWEQGMLAAGPTFEAFTSALDRLGTVFAIVQDKPDVARGKFTAWGNAGRVVGTAIVTIMEAVVDVLTVLAHVAVGVGEGFAYMGPMVTKIKAAFGSLFTALGEIVAALMGTEESTIGSADGWQTLGNVVGGVVGVIVGALGVVVSTISMTMSIVGGVIVAIRGYIMMVVGVLTGVVDVIVALLQGDWAKAWESAKGIVYSVVAGILDIVGGLVQGIAGALDKIGKLFGKDWGLRGSVSSLRDNLKGSALSALGTQEQVEKQRRDNPNSAIAAGGISGADRRASLPWEGVTPKPPAFGGALPGGIPWAPGAGERKGPEAGAAQAAAVGAAVAAAIKAQPPAVVSAVMLADGEAIGRIVMKAQAGAAAQGGVQTPVEG